ncbi:AGAP001934-PA-like protein [Anopheles sinensis]|uniref:AGAP001934-PA-like protein n=1 Tax=Anopheles sinensis TaxID=74873 RepID=A0A084VS29_ANOSI|nr:AGAP001934-PA-like protein [Anopheles sinensis]
MAEESPPRRLSQIFDPLMSLSELQAQIQQQQHQLAHLKYSGGGGGGGVGGCTQQLPLHPHQQGIGGTLPSSSSMQTFSSSSTLQHHHGGGSGGASGHTNGGGGACYNYNTTASSSTSLSSVSNQSTKLSSSSSTGSYIGGTLGSGGSGSGGGGGGGGGMGLPVPPPHVLGRIMMGSRSTPNSPRLMSRRNGSGGGGGGPGGSKPPPIPQKPSAAYIANPSLVALDCDAPWPPFTSLGPDPLSMAEGHHHGGGPGGYLHHQPEINWQERCLELQLELHRSRNQAGRVRDMLREKTPEGTRQDSLINYRTLSPPRKNDIPRSNPFVDGRGERSEQAGRMSSHSPPETSS